MTDIATSRSPSGGQESTTQKAKEEARDVGQTAVAAGGDVAQTAKQEGREVVRETARQARDLYGEARGHLRQQAGDQQRRAAGGIRSLGSELHGMAENGSGPASELARQAAGRVSGVADWLEAREPGQLVDEVKQFARRHPGTFLAGAAVLGVLAGRMTRGLVADAHDDDGGATRAYPTADPDATSAYPTTGPATGYPAANDPTVGMTSYPTVADADPDGTVYAGSTADPLPPVAPPPVTPPVNPPVERGPWDSGARP
jgi:hypothetical protein